MKKIIGPILAAAFLVSCEGAGDKQYHMKTNDSPGPDSGMGSQGNRPDASTSMEVRDSSTNTAYDTGSTKKN
jgi:hypothetical protein